MNLMMQLFKAVCLTCSQEIQICNGRIGYNLCKIVGISIKQKILIFLSGLILLPLLGSNQGPSD